MTPPSYSPCHLDPRKLLMQGGILVLDPRILGLPSLQSHNLIYLKKQRRKTLMKALAMIYYNIDFVVFF